MLRKDKRCAVQGSQEIEGRRAEKGGRERGSFNTKVALGAKAWLALSP